ncbi:CGNR zinc finger domain-containing protein [Georgenia sp. AZ-5]|uniref:CGNR zinc finger domain-containing protein n=1 Tax=Georgenia sp. AZ-5 TaxID=3367526 RepID=UPI003753EC46
MDRAPYVGGAPLLADAVALDLANTHYAVRGRPREGLGSPADVAAWAREIAPRLPGVDVAGLPHLAVEDRDVERFLELRASVRAIAGDLVGGHVPAVSDTAVVNAAADRAPSSPALAITPEGVLTRRSRAAAPLLDQILAGLAGDAVDLFAGERAARLRACQAPGCPLFFLKDHPRREWCSPSCGNRVRAARAYRKRTQRTTPSHGGELRATSDQDGRRQEGRDGGMGSLHENPA